MKKSIFLLVLALTLVLCGCSEDLAAEKQSSQTPEQTQPQETVGPTVPADGNPGDVTCQGSYTGQVNTAVVAEAGDAELTNEALQVWYWAQVAQYRQEGHEEAPDFDQPLDTQVCTIDDSVASWQQYFLAQALTAWHKAQALIQTSQAEPLPTEEAYAPVLENHEKYMTDMPATKVLYGYNSLYTPNSMHQEYLDNLPQTLEALAQEKGYAGLSGMASTAFGTEGAQVEAYAQDLNLAYMYLTHMSYYIEPAQEELDAYVQAHQADFAQEGREVDIRHILLVPDDVVETTWRPQGQEAKVLEAVEIREDGTVVCSEEAWSICEQEAQALLRSWSSNPKGRKNTTALFAELANDNSEDTGTALDGGAYYGITQGQLIDVLDDWCFDAARQPEDTTILRSEYGVHILYFAQGRDNSAALAQEDYYRQAQQDIARKACEAYPMEVDYSAIVLGEAQAAVAAGDILYADIAHERFPEVPLYLQQDYGETKYGNFRLRTNGCGITTLAMLASYMSDDELTPPELCARYGSYSHSTGTDGMIFNYEPAAMGFYLREKTYEHREAWDALMEGQIVVSVQQKGYWTRGGHYLVIESATEDKMIQVRDSNIFNYGRLQAHKEDLHGWNTVTSNSFGFWIYEDKITRIPACTRCGSGDAVTERLLNSDYTCHKCATALLRRNTYLAG